MKRGTLRYNVDNRRMTRVCAKIDAGVLHVLTDQCMSICYIGRWNFIHNGRRVT
jgi:hypothetical protein